MSKKIMRMDQLKGKNRKVGYILLIRALFIACVSILPMFTTTFAADNDLEQTYHVYVDDKHIGKVDDKNIVQQMINDKTLEGLKKYKDLTIVLEQSVTMVPEKSFKGTYHNETVREYLKKHLTIVAVAAEMEIDGQTVGYFKSEEDAEKVLKLYKLTYIDEQDLKRIEDTEQTVADAQKEEKKLSVGESIVSHIQLSDEVIISEKEISPEEILDTAQGVELLEKGTLEEKVHQVEAGEVLGSIAKDYDLSTKKLLTLNPSLSEDSVLQIGQDIHVTEYKPFVTVLVYEDEVVEEQVSYDTKVIESGEMYKGDEKVEQKGKNGKKEVEYRIETSNGNVVEKVAVHEKIIKEPVEEIIIKGTKVIPSRGSGDLIWPADGGYVSSHLGMRWGSMHKGIDIARPSTKAIFVADHGVVESAGWNNGGYGNKVVINHNNGMRTVYAHLDSIDVTSGQTVEKGTRLGTMGSTGDSTGIHLHFEVYVDGVLTNPMDYY